MEFEVLKGLMADLEKAYDEFCFIDEEFEELVMQEDYAEVQILTLSTDAMYNVVTRTLEMCLFGKKLVMTKSIKVKRQDQQELR